MVILRERGEDDAFCAVAAMQQGMVIDLDADLAMEAASVGLEEGLAFADSVILQSHESMMRHFGRKMHISAVRPGCCIKRRRLGPDQTTKAEQNGGLKGYPHERRMGRG